MLKHNHIIIVDVLCGVLSTSKRGLDSRYNIKKGVKIWVVINVVNQTPL